MLQRANAFLNPETLWRQDWDNADPKGINFPNFEVNFEKVHTKKQRNEC